MVTGHAEGICELWASTDGATELGRLVFEIYFTQPIESQDRPGFGNRCAVEGSSTCAGQTLGVCRDGQWRVNGTCPDDQVCDLVPNSEPNCTSEGPCSACRSLR
jgi:hypothetical protein